MAKEDETMETDNGMEDLIKEKCSSELKDEDINGYMKLLDEEFEDEDVLCLDSWFFAGLKMRNVDPNTNGKKGKYFHRFVKPNRRLPKRIIIPYHACENHWMLVCILTETHHVISIDPLDSMKAVLNSEYSPAFAEIEEIFPFVSSVFEFCTVPEWDYIFKSSIPWVLYRSYQKFPQTDLISCGFYVIQSARVCCQVKLDEYLFKFAIGDIEEKKWMIAREILSKSLLKFDKRTITVIQCRMAGASASLKITRRLSSKSSVMTVRCLINPNRVAKNCIPECLVQGMKSKVAREEIRDVLRDYPGNLPLTITLEQYSSTLRNQEAIIEMCSMLFDLLFCSETVIKAKRVTSVLVMIRSNAIYDTLLQNGDVVVLQHTLDQNDMVFQEDRDHNTDFVRNLNDMLACMFHRMCDITLFSMMIFKESMNMKHHIIGDYFYHVIVV